MEKLNIKIGDTLSSELAMTFAINLAQKGIGFVEPNPPVGCVILDKDNRLIGFGYHKSYGGPHAEVNAINSVKQIDKLNGSQMFVTLEPCGHQGKTPACSELISKYKFKSVQYGISDPNPKFNHCGIENIRQNGIEVIQNYFDLKPQLRSLTDSFLFSIQQKKSYITLKMASSLDGFIGLNNGESKWISNGESRKYSHKLRNAHHAILIGKNTLLNDNPSLNVREIEPEFSKENKVIVLDPNLSLLELLKKSNIAKFHKPENILIATNKALNHFNRLAIVLNDNNQINLGKLRIEMFKHSIYSVLVEGGAWTHSEFIQQNEFNCLKNFIAPHIIGARSGLSWTKGYEIKSLNDKMTLSDVSMVELNGNFLFTGFNK